GSKRRKCGTGRGNNGHAAVDEVGHQRWQAVVLATEPVVLHCDVLTFDVAGFGEALTELRARRERPRGRRAAEQRYELAASHCPMPPVLPTERIAHLGTADCCIRPPGRNEMIPITPPKIFSKEVAQNRPPHLPRQQPSSPPKIVLRQISGDEA